MGICLFGGLELVKLEDVVDEFLLAGGRSAGWVGTLRRGGSHFDGGGVGTWIKIPRKDSKVEGRE